MTTDYRPPADTEPWTFEQVVREISYAAETTPLTMPAWIRDNDPGTNLLVLEFTSAEKMRAWYQYFGTRQHRADPPVWAWGWHGWTVMLAVLSPLKDSGSADEIETPSADPVATRPEPPAVAAAVLAVTPFDRIENAAIALINWKIIPDEFVAEVKVALSDAESPLRAEIERLRGVAVRGLRELESYFGGCRDLEELDGEAYKAFDAIVGDLSVLLDKVGGTR